MKRRSSRFLSLLLAGFLVAGTLTGCGSKDEGTTGTQASQPGEASTEAGSAESAGSGSDTPLVVATRTLNQKFSPFFATTADDNRVVNLTAAFLLDSDRQGGVVTNGVEGETRNYNGTDYTYQGLADCEVTIDEATNETKYHFKLREDVTFSDGKPLTADDVIFSLYVFADTNYDGSITFYSVPVKGMKNYRANSSVAESITADDISAVLSKMPEELEKQINENIILPTLQSEFEWCADAFGEYEYESQEQMFVDFYALEDSYSAEGKDSDTIVSEIAAMYGADTAALGNAYAGDETYFNADVNAAAESYVIEEKKANGEGEDVPNIEGIRKLGDYELEVVTNGFDATTIYQLQLPISPLHYYGDPSLYDYENNQFGFTRGDLSGVHKNDTLPVGAGPYKFVKYENKTVYLEANDTYYKSAPKIKYVQIKESTDSDMIPAVAQGTVDIANPDGSKDAFEQISGLNSNGELTGDKVITSRVDNLGYGYIGMNADRISVKGERDSEASKNLRRALATVISVYRDVTIDTYYGDAASVINYPISNTSWAAPQKSDADYQVAYSVDVEGNPIYTDSMSDEEKYAAALEASLGFFEAAGYTVTDGKITAAPEGAAMEYEVVIPADGEGNHPTFGVLTDAKAALSSIGFNLVINDPADSNILWNGLDSGSLDMWCAAWQATADPDMYQVYHSSNIEGAGGSNSNHYHITDSDLDELILTGRQSDDQSFRKSIYKQCLDIIIDWAVEVPIYQRQNCFILSAERIKEESITPDITTFYEWWKEIENMEMK